MRLGGMADLAGDITPEKRIRIDVIKRDLADAEQQAAELIGEGIASEPSSEIHPRRCDPLPPQFPLAWRLS